MSKMIDVPVDKAENLVEKQRKQRCEAAQIEFSLSF
jgi:hypothetical protein